MKSANKIMWHWWTINADMQKLKKWIKTGLIKVVPARELVINKETGLGWFCHYYLGNNGKNIK